MTSSYFGQHPYTLQRGRLERGSIYGNPYTLRQEEASGYTYLLLFNQERLYGGCSFKSQLTLQLILMGWEVLNLFTNRALDRPLGDPFLPKILPLPPPESTEGFELHHGKINSPEITKMVALYHSTLHYTDTDGISNQFQLQFVFVLTRSPMALMTAHPAMGPAHSPIWLAAAIICDTIIL